MKLTPKLTLIFVIFAALLLIVVDILIYNSGHNALEAAAVAELEATAGEKKAALGAWADHKESDIQALAHDPTVIQFVNSLVRAPTLESFNRNRNELIKELEPRIRNHDFLVVMLLDPKSGTVLVATDPEEEGKPRNDRSYFLEGRIGTFLTPIYYSSELQTPAMTVSAPIRSANGRLLGVLAGRININELNAIIRRRSGVHQTDDAFLMNPSREFITQPRFLTDPAILTQGLQAAYADLCLQGKRGAIFSDDYNGVPVIAVYRWLPERQMCLITTISQSEALASEHSFAATAGWIGFASLLIASLLAVGLSHTLIRPIRTMQLAAQRYSNGDLMVRLFDTSKDELGLLAKEFNAMAASLEEKERLLRLHSLELEKEVEVRTEELRQNQMRFQALIENAPDGIALLGLDGTLRQVTPSTLQILGYTSQEAQGQDPAMLTHPDDLPGLLTLLGDLMQTPGKVARAQYRFLHKDGSWRWLESTISNLMAEPSVNAIVFNYRDITERVQAEDELREKERLLSEAQEIGQIGSVSFDIPSDQMQFSDETYRLLDILPEKFQHNSRDFMALVYPSDRLQVATWIADLRAGWQINELDFRIFRQNGELRYLHCRGAVEYNSSGAPSRFIGTMQDVTERQLAEIQINQQVKRLTALSEIDRAIIAGPDRSRALDVIISVTLANLQVDAAAILLTEDDPPLLRYASVEGFRSHPSDDVKVSLEQSHSGRVVKEKRLIRIPDLKEQTQDPYFDSFVAKEDFVSYIGVPLIVKKEVKGVFEVFHRKPFQPYQEWLDFLNTLVGQAVIAIENAFLLGNLQTSNLELSQAYDATIEGWSRAMDLRDRETEGHTRRVTDMTMEIARAMGISESKLVHIRRGALLHDVGKLGVPDHVLYKPGPLLPDEWELMQKHPELAYDMLSPIQYLKPALLIPYFHHEKWDGSGYPLGMRGDQIPLEARIFAVVDVWDALLSDRPYRKAWTVERTLEHIRLLAGTHFDPDVVDCFLRIVKG